MIFNLRDLKFREYIVKNQIHCDFTKFSLFKKDEITDRDLIRFYIEYSEYLSKAPYYYDPLIELTRIFFNYKMGKITESQLIKFNEIVKDETNVDLKKFRASYYGLYNQIFWSGPRKIEKLVNIFLDEI